MEYFACGIFAIPNNKVKSVYLRERGVKANKSKSNSEFRGFTNVTPWL